MVTKGLKRITRGTWGNKEEQGEQGVTWGNKEEQGVTRGTRPLLAGYVH